MSLVGEAESGAQALELYRTLSPDVTLMDIRMPGMNGIDVLRSLRKEYPSCAVLMLSSYDGDEDIYQALQAGARGYLLKSMRNAEIAEAIRIVHAGGHHLPPKVASRLAERLSRDELTQREQEVLSLIVRGHDNAQVGKTLGISTGTVKNHVRSLLDKLGVRDRTQATAAALQRGLVHLD